MILPASRATSNGCGLAFRVTMNVCQALLHQPEYEEFHFRRKPSKVVGDFQFNRQTAAFDKPCTYQFSADKIPLSSSSGDAEGTRSCVFPGIDVEPSLRQPGSLWQAGKDLFLHRRLFVQASCLTRQRCPRYRAVPVLCAAARNLEPPGAGPKITQVRVFSFKFLRTKPNLGVECIR